MYRIMITISYILCLGILVFAQSEEGSDLLVIDSENATQLTELYIWESYTPANPLGNFSPDGQRIALALNDGAITLISTETFEITDTIPNVDFIGDNLQFNPDGTRLLISRRDGLFSLWSIDDGNYEIISNVTDPIENTIFIPSGNLQYFYLWNSEGDLIINDLVTHDEIFRLSEVERFALSETGDQLIVMNAENIISLWDVADENLILEISLDNEIESSDLGGFGFVPTGDIWLNWQQFSEVNTSRVSSSSVVVYDVDTGMTTNLVEGEHLYHRLYFAPIEDTIIGVGTDAFGARGIISSWNLDNGQETTITEGDARGRPLTFSSTGDIFVVSLSNNQIRIYDTLSTTLLTSLFVNETYSQLRFNNDSTLLINVGLDIRIWGMPAD